MTSAIQHPNAIKNNVHAQAFYGVIAAIFAQDSSVEVTDDLSAEISIAVADIVAKHSKVDWSYSQTIHNRISQDIDDLFYQYEKENGLKVSFDTIDKIIENVKTVALRRF